MFGRETARRIGSIARLKIIGLSGHPCLTPALMEIGGVGQVLLLMVVVLLP
jgi:hypothetical protein